MKRLQLRPHRHESVTRSQLKALGAVNIRVKYWLGLRNQPQTFTFSRPDSMDVSSLTDLGAVWCLTDEWWVF